MTTKPVRAFALSLAPLTFAVVACGSSGSSAPSSNTPSQTAAPPTTAATTTAASPTNAACAAKPNPSAKPPANVPTPTDATFYQKVPVGATTQYFAFAPGNDVRARRDAIKSQLSKAGYQIKGTDAEDNEEAELEFEGKGHGESSIQVIHREGCIGQLRLRYKLGG